MQEHRVFVDYFKGRRIFITGHTGFKGSWLCEWLLALGADVTGFALAPPTSPALFDQLGLARRVRHVIGDVRDLPALQAAMDACAPDFVFHLAAQPLVRLSYEQPVETYSTNVMGTVNVLEAIRHHRCGIEGAVANPLVAVMVTTDKCYENREWLHGYREEDPMGGHDPYSSSKGAAELVVSAYRRSYFGSAASNGHSPQRPILVATARAGNVIGGGDWALDRIVPDCIRALQRNAPIIVRNARATRPWQHVLEPLSGYLLLAAEMARAGSGRADQVAGATLHNLSPGRRAALCSAFNFGPDLQSNRSVGELVSEVLKVWPGSAVDQSDPNAPHEAGRLMLAIDKAHHLLGWLPTWDFGRTVRETIAWYREVATDESLARAVTDAQIAAYCAEMRPV